MLTLTRVPQWMTRTTDYIAKVGSQQQIVLDNIAGARAAEIIASSLAPEDPRIVGFDTGEAARLGIERGQVVSVTPSDNGACGVWRSTVTTYVY